MKCILLLLSLFGSQLGFAQQISERTKKVAYEYYFVQVKSVFPVKNWLRDSVEARDRFYIEPIANKKFDTVEINIYEVGYSSDALNLSLLLIEKIQNGISKYGMLGKVFAPLESRRMCLFFQKYAFPDSIKIACYEKLLMDYLNDFTANGTEFEFIHGSFFK